MAQDRGIWCRFLWTWQPNCGFHKMQGFFNQLWNLFFFSWWTLLPVVCSVLNTFDKFTHPLNYFRKTFHLPSLFLFTFEFFVTVFASAWTSLSCINSNTPLTHIISFSFIIADCFKRDGRRAETRIVPSAKWASPFNRRGEQFSHLLQSRRAQQRGTIVLPVASTLITAWKLR